MRRLALAALVAAVVAAALVARDGRGEGDVVTRVRDGDTIELAGGSVVRLVQIDSPELGEGECYAEEARAELRRLLPAGTRVRIAEDPALDRVDRFGRQLAYVIRDGENVNLTLVERGAASVWFFQGDRGRHAGELLEAARRAQAAGIGLWGACPTAQLDPLGPVETGS